MLLLLAFRGIVARRYGLGDGRSGSVIVILRFGGGLNPNLHYYTLLCEGVFFADRITDTPWRSDPCHRRWAEQGRKTIFAAGQFARDRRAMSWGRATCALRSARSGRTP